VKNPILFLDEPTVKLDARGAEAVRELVKKINHEFGTTILLTTHFIFEAEELCGRVAIMHKGRIKSCDTVEHLRSNLARYDELLVSGSNIGSGTISAIHSLPFVVSADLQPGSATLAIQVNNLKEHLNETLKFLLDNDVQISEIATNEPTLEEIFIDTIGGEGKV